MSFPPINRVAGGKLEPEDSWENVANSQGTKLNEAFRTNGSKSGKKKKSKRQKIPKAASAAPGDEKASSEHLYFVEATNGAPDDVGVDLDDEDRSKPSETLMQTSSPPPRDELSAVDRRNVLDLRHLTKTLCDVSVMGGRPRGLPLHC
jgi:hypothetical protein